MHTSVVHGLSSSVQPVPVAFTVSGAQLELEGASAISWATCPAIPVDAFAPLAPTVACTTSLLSDDASEELVPEADWTLNRSVMPEGGPITLLSERPKVATSIVL